MRRITTYSLAASIGLVACLAIGAQIASDCRITAIDSAQRKVTLFRKTSGGEREGLAKVADDAVIKVNGENVVLDRLSVPVEAAVIYDTDRKAITTITAVKSTAAIDAHDNGFPVREVEISLSADGKLKLFVSSTARPDTETEPSEAQRPFSVFGLPDVPVYRMPDGQHRIVFDFRRLKSVEGLGIPGLAESQPLSVQVDPAAGVLKFNPGLFSFASNPNAKLARWDPGRYTSAPLTWRFSLLPAAARGESAGSFHIFLRQPEDASMIEIRLGPWNSSLSGVPVVVEQSRPDANGKRAKTALVQFAFSQGSTTREVAIPSSSGVRGLAYYVVEADAPIAVIRRTEIVGRIGPSIGVLVGGSNESKPIVTRVVPTSAAEKAGVRVGDRIASVNGTPVSTRKDLLEALRRLDVAEGGTFSIDRSGQTITITLTEL